MLGAPIAYGINRLLDRRYPQLKQKKLSQAILPDQHRVLNGQMAHGSQQRAFKRLGIDLNPPSVTPVKVGESRQPALISPDMNGGKPMR